jgi:SAM-dependent methyltransferase
MMLTNLLSLGETVIENAWRKSGFHSSLNVNARQLVIYDASTATHVRSLIEYYLTNQPEGRVLLFSRKKLSEISENTSVRRRISHNDPSKLNDHLMQEAVRVLLIAGATITRWNGIARDFFRQKSTRGSRGYVINGSGEVIRPRCFQSYTNNLLFRIGRRTVQLLHEKVKRNALRNVSEGKEVITQYPVCILRDEKTGNLEKVRTTGASELYNTAYYGIGIFAEHIDWNRRLEEYQQAFWQRMTSTGVAEGVGKRCLDIGCGTGALAGLLHQKGYCVMGIDTSPDAIQSAKTEQQKPERQHLISDQIEFRAGSIDQLIKLEEEQYDLITLAHVLEHIEADAAFLRQVKHLIKPGGKLYLETVIAEPGALENRPRWWLQTDHVREYSERGFRSVVEAAGFRIVNYKNYRDWSGNPPYQAILSEPAP